MKNTIITAAITALIVSFLAISLQPAPSSKLGASVFGNTELSTDGNAIIGGTLSVAGATTFTGAPTFSATTTISDGLQLRNSTGLCVDFYATSSATKVKLVASSTAAITGQVTENAGVMLLQYGSCVI